MCVLRFANDIADNCWKRATSNCKRSLIRLFQKDQNDGMHESDVDPTTSNDRTEVALKHAGKRLNQVEGNMNENARPCRDSTSAGSNALLL